METQLVVDLLGRLQSYKVQGVVVCRGCRTWTTEEEARAARWSYSDGGAGVVYSYCPECAHTQFAGVTDPASVA